MHTAGRLCEGRVRDGEACKAKEQPPWPADPQSWERGPGPAKLGEGSPDPQGWERGPGPPKLGEGPPDPRSWERGPRTPKAGRGLSRPPKLGEGPGAECSPLPGSDEAGLAPLISNSRLQSEDAVGVKFPQGCLSLCGHLGSVFRKQSGHPQPGPRALGCLPQAGDGPPHGHPSKLLLPPAEGPWRYPASGRPRLL